MVEDMQRAETDMDADVIVVGAGAAGALAAYGLAQRGVKVIVLEAGPRFSRAETVAKQRQIWEQDNSALYPNTALAPRTSPSREHESHIDNHGPVKFSAHYLRGVGGTTWHWQAVTPRFVPADFELKSRYGVGIDWPFGYDVLEPYYNRAEQELGVAGVGDFGAPRSQPYQQPPVRASYADTEIARRLAEFGQDFEARPTARNGTQSDERPACVGHHNCSNICPIGAQYAAIVHVQKAEALGVQILEETLATRLESDADGHITGVLWRRADGTTGRLRSRAYFVAANALETVRLCLASASETRPQGIANSSGMVGLRLMDHYNMAARFNLPFPVYPGRGPLTGFATAQWRDGSFRKDHAAFLLGFENIDMVSEVATQALQMHGADPQAVDATIRDLAARRVEMNAIVEQLPDPSNRVWLDHAHKDSSGMPRIQVHYGIDEYAQRGRKAARKQIEQTAAQLGASPPEIRETFFAVHAAGTMMMGQDKRQFVTDGFGRCHDHSNLFIGGAALFPANSTANPTLTIAALALRTEAAIAAQLAQ
ncbi:GMC family oxidoreductase [Pseudophaeobacter sp.]|uniref:GMC family oxidoreductase n=1 Tax=Pseudophaeobacter sp. TaxID=1971739 RepID=UPI0032990752